MQDIIYSTSPSTLTVRDPLHEVGNGGVVAVDLRGCVADHCLKVH